MMLACASMYRTDPSLVSAIAWSLLIVVPTTAFLLLPKLVPLRRRLMWLGARASLVVLRLLAGAREAAAWRARLDEAFARDVAANHAGTRRQVVADDARLVGRVKIAGLIALAATALLAGWIAFALAHDGETGAAGVFAAGAVPAAWLARAAGEAAALFVLGYTVGRRSWLARLAVGGLLGGAGGALGGWAVGVAGALLFVPAMSMLHGAPSGEQVLQAFAAGGAFCATLGTALGALACAAIAAPRRR